MIFRSIKYKLIPTKAQIEVFEKNLWACRFVYNCGLELQKSVKSSGNKYIHKYELSKQLTEAKKEFNWLKEPSSLILENALVKLDSAFQNFFKKRAGYPKFAKKNKFNSFTFKTGVKIHVDARQITLPKIGKIKFFKDKILAGDVASATIKKEVDGWYACILIKQKRLPISEAVAGGEIGIDLGLKHFAITSDGEFFDAPNLFRKSEKKLKKLQKTISKKKRGSNNRKKAINKLAIIHKKISNSRKDFLHKLSTRLVKENQFISVEKLMVKNIVKNKKLSKSISDAGWGMFAVMLKYKCDWYNKELRIINPAYTSKACNNCGWINDALTLNDRFWICSECGIKHNRDLNAAKNILKKGFGLNLSTCGENVNPTIIGG